MYRINITLDAVEEKYQSARCRVRNQNEKQIKDLKTQSHPNNKWDNIKLPKKYVIAVHKVKEPTLKKYL